MHPNATLNGGTSLAGVITVESGIPGVSVLVCDSAKQARGQVTDSLVTSAPEAERAARLHDPAARQRLLVSLASARAMLGLALDIPAREVDLARTEDGVPYLASRPDRAVSISRSEGWTAVALADARAIGLDIEQVRPIDWQPMLSMICSDTERDQMLALADAPPERALAVFFALWTVKEAVLKASGKGLRGGAKTVPVPVASLGQPAPTRQDVSVGGARYAVWTEQIEDVFLSVAVGDAR
ncbi:4'-phosphopantetheinyl transferase superfamily protein [Hyphomonas sp.]|uniref:4'-phosphopantetheinyl transferase family protein n=1 Tax=Hyphomonas sp. TaxID=87 RepID=UPI0030F79F1F